MKETGESEGAGIGYSDEGEKWRWFVGYPDKYDILGAAQFRLLTSLGLRSHDRLLDVGCGSLRAGRLFIAYLDAGNYYGIEPNSWLVTEGISKHLGEDIRTVKMPRFSSTSDFSSRDFRTKFDFVLAHSIFTHTGCDQLTLAMTGIGEAMAAGGLAAATFCECRWPRRDFAGTGWIYPGTVRYSPKTITRCASEAGLVSVRIGWNGGNYQRWWLFAHSADRLPGPLARRRLRGRAVDSRDRHVWKEWAALGYYKLSDRWPFQGHDGVDPRKSSNLPSK